MFDCAGLKDGFLEFIKTSQTTLGKFQATVFVVFGICLISGASIVQKDVRLNFACETTAISIRQTCLDAYDANDNILNASLTLPITFLLVPLAVWVLSAWVITAAKEHTEDPAVHYCFHIAWCYLMQLVVRCIFFIGTMVYYLMHIKEMTVKSTYMCKVITNGSFRNQTRYIDIKCPDQSYRGKTSLNFGYLALSCILVTFGLIELFWLLKSWYIKRSACHRRSYRAPCEQEAGSSTAAVAADCRLQKEDCSCSCREFKNKYLDKDACGTSQNLKDESQLLKDYYNDVYSKHDITVVTEDGKHIDRDERNIRDFAVEVAIAERGEIDDDVNNERLKFIQKMDSIRNTSKIELSDLLGEERITYIRGVAGIGKTVVSKQIALKWANNEIYKDFSFVLLIESRDLSDSKLNLEDFMKDRSFPNPEQINARDILFIIDGLDEVENLHDELRQSDSKLSQLLRSHKFRESKFILTGRPHVERILKQAVTLIGKMKVFEVCGLSGDSIGNYISMFTKQNQAKIDEIKKARDASESVKSTLNIPQYLNTFCCVSLMTGGKAIRNVTELYVWLLYIFLAQHFNKKNDTDIEPAALFGKFSILILKLSEISFKLLEKKKIIFTKKEFKSTLQEIEADEEMAEAFQSFCCVRSEGYQVQKRYQFLHLTLQEFLASVFCYVNEIKPEYLIKNDNYEIIVFLSGFHGTKLETEDQEEDTVVKIFVEGCVEKEEEIRDDSDKPFIIKLLKGLKDKVDDDYIRLERAMACLCEYLSNRSKYCNQTHVGKVLKELIHVVPPHEDSKGRSLFRCVSSIAQSNFVTVLDICENYDSLCIFKNVHLEMGWGLFDFGLCKYFNYFSFVSVTLLNPESVDKFNLFLNYCKYCNYVVLLNCKIVGYLELDKLSRELGGANDESRLEQLWLSNCEIDEKNWIGLWAVIVKVKRVQLERIKMEESQWRSLADVIEEEKKDQRLKLEDLTLSYCEIDEKNWIGLCAVIVKVKTVKLEGNEMEESEWRSLADAIEEEKKDQRLKLEELTLFFCNIIDMELVERIRKAGVYVSY